MDEAFSGVVDIFARSANFFFSTATLNGIPLGWICISIFFVIVLLANVLNFVKKG